jgi:hypothetical protein
MQVDENEPLDNALAQIEESIEQALQTLDLAIEQGSIRESSERNT